MRSHALRDQLCTERRRSLRCVAAVPGFATEECEEFGALFGDDDLPGSTADPNSASFERGELDGQGGVVENAEPSVVPVGGQEDIGTSSALPCDGRRQRCTQETAEAASSDRAAGGGEAEGLEATDSSVSLPERSGVGGDSFAVALTGTSEVPDPTGPTGFRSEFARKGRAAPFLSLGAVGAESVHVGGGPLLRRLLHEAG